MDPFAIHVELSESWEELVPKAEEENEVTSQVPATKKDGHSLAHNANSDKRVANPASRSRSTTPLITTIRLSSAALPDDGAPHLPNQPNPITLATVDQPKPLAVILQPAASPTRSASVSILRLEEEEEVDGAESRPIEQEPAEVELEDVDEARVEAKAVAAPAVEVMQEEVEGDASPVEQPKKRVKRKANQSPQSAAAPKKSKSGSSLAAGKKA